MWMCDGDGGLSSTRPPLDLADCMHHSAPVTNTGSLQGSQGARPAVAKPSRYRSPLRQAEATATRAAVLEAASELAALQLDDLRGHDLRIVRAVLAEQVSITRTGRTRRVTLGAITALL